MLKFLSLIICVFAGYSTAAFVDTLNKCPVKDNECLKDLYTKVIQEGIGSKGVPELGIPSVDPIELKNVTVSVFGVLELTLVKGKAIGISGCVFDVFTVDLEKGSGHQENTCSITIDSQYKITPTAIVNAFLGENAIHAEGNAKVELNKLHLKFDFPVHAQKRGDGQTYLKVDYKNIDYEYEVLGNSVFDADNIYFGGVETSKTILPFLNHNEKFVIKTFGKPFIDTAAGIYFDYAGKFFDVVPTKHYIADDLSSIAKE